MQLQLNLGHQKPKLGGQPNIISYIYCSIHVKSHKDSCHALQDIHSSLVEKEERKKFLNPVLCALHDAVEVLEFIVFFGFSRV